MAELSAADRALLTEAQERARARMSGRTIDETGKDISERRPEPEPIRTGWYWTGHFCVWVICTTQRGQYVYYQTAAGCKWLRVEKTTHWVRVHEQVEESGQGFGWSPAVQTR